jgi:hypothetical protein
LIHREFTHKHLLSGVLGLDFHEQAIQGTCFHTYKRQKSPHIAGVSKKIRFIGLATASEASTLTLFQMVHTTMIESGDGV